MNLILSFVTDTDDPLVSYPSVQFGSAHIDLFYKLINKYANIKPSAISTKFITHVNKFQIDAYSLSITYTVGKLLNIFEYDLNARKIVDPNVFKNFVEFYWFIKVANSELLSLSFNYIFRNDLILAHYYNFNPDLLPPNLKHSLSSGAYEDLSKKKGHILARTNQQSTKILFYSYQK